MHLHDVARSALTLSNYAGLVAALFTSQRFGWTSRHTVLLALAAMVSAGMHAGESLHEFLTDDAGGAPIEMSLWLLFLDRVVAVALGADLGLLWWSHRHRLGWAWAALGCIALSVLALSEIVPAVLCTSALSKLLAYTYLHCAWHVAAFGLAGSLLDTYKSTCATS